MFISKKSPGGVTGKDLSQTGGVNSKAGSNTTLLGLLKDKRVDGLDCTFSPKSFTWGTGVTGHSAGVFDPLELVEGPGIGTLVEIILSQ